jgi:hypothetical protein
MHACIHASIRPCVRPSVHPSMHPSIHYNTMQYNTIRCNTIQYNTVQYNTLQIKYNTIQCNFIPYNSTQYNPIQSNTTQHNTTQHNTIQYNTMHTYTDTHTHLREFPVTLTLTYVLFETCALNVFFSGAGTFESMQLSGTFSDAGPYRRPKHSAACRKGCSGLHWMTQHKPRSVTTAEIQMNHQEHQEAVCMFNTLITSLFCFARGKQIALPGLQVFTASASHW